MSVVVRIPTPMRSLTGGERAVSGSGSTVAEVLHDLEACYPGLGERLFEDGRLRRFVNVFVGDEDVRFLEGLETPVQDGQELVILPAVAGGER